MLIRIGLGLNKSSGFSWLETWLKQKSLILFLLKNDNPGKIIREQPIDLLILTEDFLPTPGPQYLKEILRQKDAVDILLLNNHDSVEAQSVWLAAGCSLVLPQNLSRPLIKQTIENFIKKRPRLLPGGADRQSQRPAIADFVVSGRKPLPYVEVAKKLVNSDSSLLILGETGVGKERLAKAIHFEGARGRGPFIPVNCAALPDNLLESELFGHEQGAFTGAVRARRGAFELAHKGTIFLDEIGDMPLHLQSKLLRVLQEKEFQKIGGEKIIRVDVRIMAATNHDLAHQVETRKFRKDLFYRLGVVSLTIPPLRTRPEEIPELIYNLIRKKLVKNSADANPVAPEALKALLAYGWPGNVRELMNILERAFLLGNGSLITAADLPAEMLCGIKHKFSIIEELTAKEEPVFALHWKEARQEMIQDFGRRYFEMLMQRSAGKMAEAAQIAGITPRALHQKLACYGIKKEKYKRKTN